MIYTHAYMNVCVYLIESGTLPRVGQSVPRSEGCHASGRGIASCDPGISLVHEAEGTPSEGCTPEGEAVPSRGPQGTPGPPPPRDGTSLDRGRRGVYLPPSILRAKGSQARAWHSITTS